MTPDRWPPDPDMLDRLRAANKRAEGMRDEAQRARAAVEQSRRAEREAALQRLKDAIGETMAQLRMLGYSDLGDADREYHALAGCAIARARKELADYESLLRP